MREHEVAEKVASMTWRDEPGATYAVGRRIARRTNSSRPERRCIAIRDCIWWLL